jgi:hypothetical protein
MAKKCRRLNCPDCGDNLTHQTDRGLDESSSAYGQHIHDTYDNQFFWADIDGVIYKMATGIMRVVEHKPRGGTLRQSQTRILPMFASAVDILAAEEIVNADSGVFVINSDWPYSSALVRRFRRDDDGLWVPGRTVDGIELSGGDLVNFETGMPVDRLGLVGRAVA